jgi:RNA polymerase sigma-70 factor (ECF subfamily)
MIDNQEDKNKFEEIYYKYKNLMLNRAYDILNDSGLAEDAVQNSFLIILKNISKINDIESKKTKGYVLVITENSAKKIYNKEHKIIKTDFQDYEPVSNVEDSFESKNSVEVLKEQIESLADIYSSVMILKYFNDLNDKEIASALSISVPTVRKRILRGRKILLSSIKAGE